MNRSLRVAVLILAAGIALAGNSPAWAQAPSSRPGQRSAPPPPAAPAPPPAPTPLETLPPYEPQFMRLAEIMGALTYLRDLCGAKDGAKWQAKMDALLQAENPSEARRERLAGAFNRGFRAYEVTYRACTDNARVIVDRFLDEGGRLAREISGRYSGG